MHSKLRFDKITQSGGKYLRFDIKLADFRY
jgi:hypothetical protein